MSQDHLLAEEILLFKRVVDFKDATLSEVMEALPKGVTADPVRVRELLDGLVSKGLIEYKGGAHDLYFVHESNLGKLLSLFSSSSGFQPIVQHLRANGTGGWTDYQPVRLQDLLDFLKARS